MGSDGGLCLRCGYVGRDSRCEGVRCSGASDWAVSAVCWSVAGVSVLRGMEIRAVVSCVHASGALLIACVWGDGDCGAPRVGWVVWRSVHEAALRGRWGLCGGPECCDARVNGAPILWDRCGTVMRGTVAGLVKGGSAVILASATVLVALAPIGSVQTHPTFSVPIVHNVPIGEILEGESVTEEFSTRWAGVSVVSVLFATYARRNAILLSIGMVGARSKRGPWSDVAHLSIAGQLMRDNTFLSLDLSGRADRYFRMTVTSDGRPGNAVTFWTVPRNVIRAQQASASVHMRAARVNGVSTGLYPIVTVSWIRSHVPLWRVLGRLGLYIWRVWGW